jgi:hypothetical protein
MSRSLRFTSWFAPLVVFMLIPFFGHAQDAASPMSVTGCLKQGTEKGGYFVAAQGGKMYELIGKAATFSPHVNHTVTVTGTAAQLPESQEAKLTPHEKTEAGSGTYSDLQVTDLKMVSASCAP